MGNAQIKGMEQDTEVLGCIKLTHFIQRMYIQYMTLLTYQYMYCNFNDFSLKILFTNENAILYLDT